MADVIIGRGTYEEQMRRLYGDDAPKVTNLINDAADAAPMFDEDELERYADKLRAKEKRDANPS